MGESCSYPSAEDRDRNHSVGRLSICGARKQKRKCAAQKTNRTTVLRNVKRDLRSSPEKKTLLTVTVVPRHLYKLYFTNSDEGNLVHANAGKTCSSLKDLDFVFCVEHCQQIAKDRREPRRQPSGNCGPPRKLLQGLSDRSRRLTSPSFCTTASERVYITTSSGKGANGGSQGAVGDRRAAICGAKVTGAGGL